MRYFLQLLKSLFIFLYFKSIYFLHIRPSLKTIDDEFIDIDERIKDFSEGQEIVWKPTAESYGGKHFYGRIQSISPTVMRIILDDGKDVIGVNPKEVYRTNELLPK